MLAKFLAQKYKGKPWNSRTVDSQYIYGSAVGRDGSGEVHRGGYGVGSTVRGEGMGGGYGSEDIGMRQFGRGRMKGM